MKVRLHDVVYLVIIVLSFVNSHAHSGPPAQASLDIAFVMDGSGSIDSTDFALQKNGLRAAILNQDLVPRDGTIAITLVQYAGSSTNVEVPFTVINSTSDATSVANQISAISQLGGATNPGDGVNSAASILSVNARPNANQNICLSTDGIPNSGASIASAVASAMASGIDSFGVIGIRCPGIFEESNLNSVYDPLVFGGGGTTMVFSSAEFANAVGPACFGDQIKLIGLEVIQSVQDWKNTATLIEGKLTYVRAHFEPADPAVMETTASARLRGYRGGVELAGSPLTASNPGARIKARQNAASRRGSWADSLNFRLPNAWANGTVRLVLEGLGGDIDCTMAAIGMDCETTVTFETTNTPDIKWIAVNWSHGGTNHNPTAADITQLQQRFNSMAPISSSLASTGSMTYSGPFSGGKPITTNVNEQLESKRFWDGCISFFGCDRLYYGALVGPDIGGRANGIPGTVACGTKQNAGYGVNRHTHEIGHTVGVRHAPYCGAVDPSAPTFPYTANIGGMVVPTLGPMSMGPDDMIWGLAANSQTVIDPNTIFDLMGYCGGFRWNSKFTYNNLRTGFNSTFNVSSSSSSSGLTPPLLGADPHLLVRGIIDLQINTASVLPLGVIELPQSPPEPIAGPYSLELLDMNGGVLNSIPFDVVASAPDCSRLPIYDCNDTGADDRPVGGPLPDDQIGSFHIPVALTSDIRGVQIKFNGVVIGDAIASPNSPIVVVQFPNGGENIDSDTFDIQWMASDADNDPLCYIVQYSADGGAIWETLAIDWKATTLTVPTNFISGSDMALIRVYASDGFNIGFDESDQFFLTDGPPLLHVLSPNDGDSFSGVQNIYFSATAQDVEDGILSDDSVSWTSDVDGLLGTGKNLIVSATMLSEANHAITAKIMDSAGNQVTQTVNIAVEVIFEPPAPDCNGNEIPDSEETEPDFIAPNLNASPQPICTNAEYICPSVEYSGSNLSDYNGDVLFCSSLFGANDIWYRYRPSWTGQVFISVAGPPLEWLYAVYDGCPDEGGQFIDCNSTGHFSVVFDGERGHDYFIRIASRAFSQGTFSLILQGPDCLANELDIDADGMPDDCQCLLDVNGDGLVDVHDFAQAVLAQGPCNGCPEDVDGSGEVNEFDFRLILNNLGPCESTSANLSTIVVREPNKLQSERQKWVIGE